MIKSTLSNTDIRGRLEEHSWWIDQEIPKTSEIKERILSTVAPEHQKLARDGATFSICNDRSGSEGLISSESGLTIIRVKSEGIISLQRDCERIVHFLVSYCRDNKQYCEQKSGG